MPGVKQTRPQAQASAPAKTKTPPAPKPDVEDDGTGSFEDVFDKAKAQGQVRDGKFEAIIRELVLQPVDKEKGQSVRMKYHIISEGDEQGSEVTQWYGIRTPENTPGPGLGFLKRDLAVLGYQDVRFGDLEEIFQAITENQELGVLITVKNNPPFTNAYLNGMMPEADDVLAYREAHPF